MLQRYDVSLKQPNFLEDNSLLFGESEGGADGGGAYTDGEGS